MIEFDDYLSNYCKEYYKKNPQYYPDKLARTQYLLLAYENDVSNPPAIKDIFQHLQKTITREDDFYDDVQKYINVTSKAITDFKTDRKDFLYCINDFWFENYRDLEEYIEYEKASIAEEDYTPFEKAQMKFVVDKCPKYMKPVNAENYINTYIDYFYNNRTHMVLNSDGNIINIYDPSYPLLNNREDEDYPKLARYHKVYLPYKPGDILCRKGPSLHDEDNYNTYMMLFDWNDHMEDYNKREISKSSGCDEIQISMGEFHHRMFFYDHLQCVYEFDLYDIDSKIDSCESDFWKDYYRTIKYVSEQVKTDNLSFDQAIELSMKTLTDFAQNATNDQALYWNFR